MSNILQNLHPEDEEKQIVVDIDCMEDATVFIKPVKQDKYRKLRRENLKRNKLDFDKFAVSLGSEGIQGWKGITEGKVFKLIGALYQKPDDFDPDREIPYSTTSKTSLLQVCRTFRDEMFNLLSDEAELTEAKENAKRKEEEVKNLPSSAGGGSAESSSAVKGSKG